MAPECSAGQAQREDDAGPEPVSQPAPALPPTCTGSSAGSGSSPPSLAHPFPLGAGGDVSVKEINLQFGQVCW